MGGEGYYSQLWAIELVSSWQNLLDILPYGLSSKVSELGQRGGTAFGHRPRDEAFGSAVELPVATLHSTR